jgi:predicted DNA-binding protein
VRALSKTDTQIGFRVTSEFKARLEAQAQRERRAVSNLILKVLEEYLDAVEPEGTKPQN